MSATIEANGNYSVKDRFKYIDTSSAYAIMTAAHKGIKPTLFYDLSAVIKMPEKVLAGIINLSARTISNYKEQKKKLQPAHSEHLLKLIALYEKGENIFGSIDEFNYWLKKPFWNTRETPFNWMITPGGVDLLMEELDKLSQGYPV